MSAWIVNKEHVGALVRWVLDNDREALRFLGFDMSTENGPEQFAGLLWAENITSVNHRYPDHTPEEPEAFTLSEILRAPKLTAIECVKACHCLAYQSCEHPAWETSRAKRALDHIEAAAISKVPGYDAAPWGIDAKAVKP